MTLRPNAGSRWIGLARLELAKLELARFTGDTRANVAVIAALLMTVVMGFAALAVDVGKMFTDRRKAQGTVDLAAMAAASDLANAVKAANATVSRNGYGGDTSVTVELGTYTANAAVAANTRFTPSSAPGANAARVTLQTTTKLLFGKVLTHSDSFAIKTSAIATQSAFAEFAIGSRLLQINNGILNSVLGGLLGANLSLSVMDYQSLINAKVDLFDFVNAIATSAQITGPTYNSVLGANVKVGTVLNALATTEQNVPGASGAASALSSVASSYSGGSTKMSIAPLVNLGPYSTMPLGQKPKTSVTVSALDVLNAAAQIANGQNQANVALGVNLPGILGATLQLSVGARPINTSWITVGMAGAQVHTAQTRLLLTVQVGGTGSIASVSVPIYVELASATASLTNVTCTFPVSASTVSLGVTPSVIDAWIGNVSSAQFNNFTSAPNPPAAMLVNAAGLLQVTGLAHVTISNMSPQNVTFSYSDISQQTKKTVTTTNFTSSLTSQLLASLQLNANVLGLGLGLPGVLTSQVANILAGATSPIDQLLASVLSALGVGIGQADVWVPGIRCDGAVLVN
ncbi:TadG family pilus assembly protein [Rhodoplanes sp. Z2-YC6860]|uniref:TadG family pilus assembly protein n=1 Tax=Rhodoplanes sp. Z2-YC6860 TaxID=674703 RepID=UPI00078E4FE9|nr:TadG family pilus assembly protein [Rhodoplanes sp. Z2-YC6860]AMN41411.1 hypothetical protein RHPLAN_29750 [Rhodoplanes sp. Z2-YC6860]